MRNKISQDFIENLLSIINIVDIINERIKLKKQGNFFRAHCPFHHENTPSFTVNEKKQFFYCFGCGSHGNVINFLMKYENLSFIESIEELSTKTGLSITYLNEDSPYQEKFLKKKKFFYLMSKLNYFYHVTINNPESKEARKFLKKRGLNKFIISYFSIGYVPKNWMRFIKNKSLSLLQDIGMITIKKNYKIYDRFKDRIVFPIRDIYGRTIAFGGRSIDYKTQPKYINSPETEIFQKKKQLYGLYEVKKYNPNPIRLLIVEGYIDVLTLVQFGIYYVISTLGTIITTKHVQSIYQITDCIILCYDGDQAGREASWRSLLIILEYLTDKKQLYFIFLPDGEDPDTFIRKKGKIYFEKEIEKAVPFSMFLFETLISKINFYIPENRIKLGVLAMSLINKIPGKILKLYLRKQLGKKLGIIDDIQLNQFVLKNTKKRYNNLFLKKNVKITTFNILIGLLIQNPKLSLLVSKKEGLEKFRNFYKINFFLDIVRYCQSKSCLNTAQILEHYRNNKYYIQLETLAYWNHMIVEEMIEITFIEALIHLHKILLRHRQEKLIIRDRIQNLTLSERHELWILNQALSK